MKKGDQLCILRAEVKTDADALNLLRLVAALTAIGIPLDDDCPYLETRELVENVERRLVTWTLKAKSICGQHDARKIIFDEVSDFCSAAIHRRWQAIQCNA